MPSRMDEHIDQLIRETIQSHMQKAGEPRPELLWARIQNEIAAPGENRRRSLCNHSALSKWRIVGAAAAACLAAGMVFFYTAPAVLESDIGHKQVAVEETATNPAPGTVPEMAPDSGPEMAPGTVPVQDRVQDPVPQGAPHEETKGRDKAQYGSSPPVAAPDEDAEAPAPDKHQMTGLSGPAQESAQVGPTARMLAVSEPETKEGLTRDDAVDTVPFPVYYPAYIPPGFTRGDTSHETVSARDKTVSVTFVRTEEAGATIQFTQSNAGDEDATAEQGRRVQIGGNEGTLRVDGKENGKRSHLRWRRDDMVFEIHGDVKPAEIIRMAESLQP